VETITGGIPECGDEICASFLSAGSPFALLNYCPMIDRIPSKFNDDNPLKIERNRSPVHLKR
jgi:hypothetical protein